MNHIYRTVVFLLTILNDQNMLLTYQLSQVYLFPGLVSILVGKLLQVVDKDNELLLIFEVLPQYLLQFEHHILRYIEFYQIYQL